MSGEFSITASGLSHSYRVGGVQQDVLSNVSFALAPGQCLSILGTNGSGKTTLLSCVAGLEIPRRGTVEIRGSRETRPEATIALLHQDYRETNFPWATALSNVTYPLRFRGIPAEVRDLAGRSVLAELLPEVDPESRANELSGGQQQLLAIARALAAKPDVVLGDEPLSALDSIRGIRAIEAIERAWVISKFAMIWISHDIDEALLLGDFVALMSRRSLGFDKIMPNPLPRPRVPTDLTKARMVEVRLEILGFLLSNSV